MNNKNKLIMESKEIMNRFGENFKTYQYVYDIEERIRKGKISGIADELNEFAYNYIINNKDLEEKLSIGTEMYRARIIDFLDYKCDSGIDVIDNKLCGYNEKNSREPLLWISGEGRNNIEGMSYFYAASNPEIACAEVRPNRYDFISVSKFITKKEMKIIDLTNKLTMDKRNGTFIQLYIKYLEIQYAMPVRNKEMYKLTQLLSDIIRKSGYDALKYKSQFSDNGYNLTIFNSSKNYLKYIKDESKVYRAIFNKMSFVDFNNIENKIYTKNNSDFDKSVRDDLMKDIEAHIIKVNLKNRNSV